MKRITANLSIKLISLLSAIVIWTVSMDMINPVTDEVTKAISKEAIIVKNDEHIKKENKDYQINDEKITVYYKTLRNINENIKDTDLGLYIDLENVTSSTDLEVKHSANDNIRIIKVDPPKVRVLINDRTSKSLPVLHSNPLNVKTGIIVGDNIKLEPEIVDVKGNEIELEKIGYLSVDIDLANSTYSNNEDEGYSKVKIYDKTGVEMPNDQFEIVPSIIKYTVTFYSTANIDVTVKPEGELEQPNVFLGTIVDPNIVAVSGPKSEIEKINRDKKPIEIKVNISGLTENKEFKYNLSDYLQNGLTSKTKEISVTAIINNSNVINQPKETDIGPHMESETSVNENLESTDTSETAVSDNLESSTAAVIDNVIE